MPDAGDTTTDALEDTAPTDIQSCVIPARMLARNTSAVLSQLAETRQPMFITIRGRFVAMLMPLEPGAVELAGIKALDLALDAGFSELPALSTAEAAAALGIELPESPLEPS